MKAPSGDRRAHSRSVTSEPDGAASEASSGAHDLPSLASTDMVGLVHHVGRSLEILKKKNRRVRDRHWCFWLF